MSKCVNLCDNYIVTIGYQILLKIVGKMLRAESTCQTYFLSVLIYGVAPKFKWNPAPAQAAMLPHWDFETFTPPVFILLKPFSLFLIRSLKSQARLSTVALNFPEVFKYDFLVFDLAFIKTIGSGVSHYSVVFFFHVITSTWLKFLSWPISPYSHRRTCVVFRGTTNWTASRRFLLKSGALRMQVFLGVKLPKENGVQIQAEFLTSLSDPKTPAFKICTTPICIFLLSKPGKLFTTGRNIIRTKLRTANLLATKTLASLQLRVVRGPTLRDQLIDWWDPFQLRFRTEISNYIAFPAFFNLILIAEQLM